VKGLSGLLLEFAYLLRDVAEINILAINLGKSLECIAGIASLFIGQAQIVL